MIIYNTVLRYLGVIPALLRGKLDNDATSTDTAGHDSFRSIKASRLLQNGTLPPDWRIWIGRYQRHRLPERWTHCSVPIYERQPVTTPSGLPQCNTQTTTFMIGELLVHTMSAAFPNHARDWDWRTWPRGRQVLTQIWPIAETATVWPIQSVSLTDADAYSIARAFFGWVDMIGRAATTGLIIRP
jgi:hypothetical protein